VRCPSHVTNARAVEIVHGELWLEGCGVQRTAIDSVQQLSGLATLPCTNSVIRVMSSFSSAVQSSLVSVVGPEVVDQHANAWFQGG
jgi:hypothetical protein